MRFFDKPALVMDYLVISGFYMGYCDPPWGKPPGHLLPAYVQEKMISMVCIIDDSISISGRSSNDGSTVLCKQNIHDGMADDCLTSLLHGSMSPND